MSVRENTAGPGGSQGVGPGDDGGGDVTSQTVEQEAVEVEDELAKLRRMMQELEAKNLRLIADTRNLQARFQRDKEEAIKYAEAEFARDLLVVIDDLERALDAAAGDEKTTAVLDGVRIAHEHFLKVLRSRGIQQIETVGKPFDPLYHEALMQQPSHEHPAGVVIQELARGYVMHARVLRSARVIVSSGPSSASGANA